MSDAASPWDLIDLVLVNLKVDRLSEEMLASIADDERQIRFDNLNNQNREITLRLEMYVRRADEQVEKTYQIYCEVWEKQGYTKTAEFVRAVSEKVIPVVIKARTRGVVGTLDLEQVRTNGPAEPHGARMAGFQQKMERLLARWQRKLEIEARECEHLQQRSTVSSGRKRSPRPRPPCFQSAVTLLRSNPDISLKDFCLLMDRKAEQYPSVNKYRPPEKWNVKSFHAQYIKRSNTVSRFLTDVRKMLRQTEGS